MERLRPLAPLLAVILFGVGAVLVRNELHGHTWAEVKAYAGSIPWWTLVLAQLASLSGVAALVGGDIVVMRGADEKLTEARIGLASFVGRAVSRVFGFGGLSAGPTALRFLSSWEVAPGVTARWMTRLAMSVWVGPAISLGVTLVVAPEPPGGLWGRLGGATVLTVLIGIRTFSMVRKEPFQLGPVTIPAIGPLPLVVVGTTSLIEHGASALALWMLLPEKPDFISFLAAFILAGSVGAMSGIPGGAGAFEGGLMALLGDQIEAPALVGSLLLWRLIDDVVPLVIAALVYGRWEVTRWRGPWAEASRAGLQWVAPALLSSLFAVSGAVLVVSAAVPAVPERLVALVPYLPAPVIEASHVGQALCGVALLLVARATWLRLAEGWRFGMFLCAVGFTTVLFRGLGVEEALLLAFTAGIGWVARGRFTRRAAFKTRRLSASWLAAAAAVLLGAICAAAFSFEGLPDEGWWTRFDVLGEGPRAARALAVAGLGLGVAGLGLMLRRAPPALALPTEAEMAEAQAILAKEPRAHGQLALLGDKALVFDDDRRAFAMVGSVGAVWVVYSDPVGPREAWGDLLWDLRELADAHGVDLGFYEVGAEALPHLVELGYAAFKFGEEARVPLEGFSLEGGANKSRRQSVKKVENSGAVFEIVAREAVAALIPDLKAVSDAWLGGKTGKEKGFSLGYFEPGYLARNPVAVVRHEGKVVAFANILEGGDGGELTVDLMRFSPDAPDNTMDFLFTKLMLWGKERGRRWFNLGMAPLSGLPDNALAPVWSRLGALMFREGEDVYNFQGLRKFKDKYHPEWEPRFLAVKGTFALAPMLAATARLVSGSWTGVIRK